jgi:cleavage and polyadenylation specificity factor subunit 2
MSTLKVTPIYGSTGHHPSSSSISLPPSSTLVEYGGVRVLVNVGSDESSGPSSLPPLDLNIDAIIITDSSLHALGGLPQYMNLRARQKYAEYGDDGDVKNMHDDVPIYATFPLLKMGQMNLYDHHSNLALDGGNPGYSLEDVDELFSPSLDSISSTNGSTNMNEAGTDSRKNRSRAIQTLKYAQTIILNCPSTGKPAISITPHRAGHTIGAAYYILTRLADETEVVVAPTYHHAKEKHLDSSDLYKYASACDVLVTTCGGPGGDLGQLYVATGENKKSILNPPSVGRDEGELVEYILSTLRRGGNVLLPVDASGRVLELLYLLNQHWDRQRLGSTYNLCWVGSMVHNTIEFARSQLEWMATPLGAQFDSGRGHPFSCKSVQMFSTVAEMESACFGSGGVEAESMNGNPTCVLASGCSLDCGPARDLFLKWSENADNAVIFTDSRRAVQRFNVLESRRSGIFGGVVTSSTDQHMLENSVKDVVTSNLGTINTAAGSETPNIVQEEEEGRKMINIGALVSSENVSIYSTSAQLLKKWCEAKAAKEEMADSVECDVLVPKRTPLAGTELKVYLAQEESKRQKRKAEEERRAMLREVELVKGRLRVTEEDNTAGASTLGSGAVSGQALVKQADADAPTSSSTSRPKKKSRFDANLFLKFSKPCHSKFAPKVIFSPNLFMIRINIFSYSV